MWLQGQTWGVAVDPQARCSHHWVSKAPRLGLAALNIWWDFTRIANYCRASHVEAWPFAPRHAIAQLQLALRTQQKAVESIFNASSVDTERELRQLQASDAKLREALTPSTVQRKPPQTQTVATPSLSGLVSFGEAASEDASEGSSEISLAPPTAKLYTPGRHPGPEFCNSFFVCWINDSVELL